jgi:hypothetical protein
MAIFWIKTIRVTNVAPIMDVSSGIAIKEEPNPETYETNTARNKLVTMSIRFSTLSTVHYRSYRVKG